MSFLCIISLTSWNISKLCFIGSDTQWLLFVKMKNFPRSLVSVRTKRVIDHWYQQVCSNDVIEYVPRWRHKLTCCKWRRRFKLENVIQHHMLNYVSDREIYQTCIFLIDHWFPYASAIPLLPKSEIVSDLVGNPEDRFSDDAVHIIDQLVNLYSVILRKLVPLHYKVWRGLTEHRREHPVYS